MEININESMRCVLEQCVVLAISKKAWIGVDEVSLEEALEFLKEIRE